MVGSLFFNFDNYLFLSILLKWLKYVAIAHGDFFTEYNQIFLNNEITIAEYTNFSYPQKRILRVQDAFNVEDPSKLDIIGCIEYFQHYAQVCEGALFHNFRYIKLMIYHEESVPVLYTAQNIARYLISLENMVEAVLARYDPNNIDLCKAADAFYDSIHGPNSERFISEGPYSLREKLASLDGKDFKEILMLLPRIMSDISKTTELFYNLLSLAEDMPHSLEAMGIDEQLRQLLEPKEKLPSPDDNSLESIKFWQMKLELNHKYYKNKSKTKSKTKDKPNKSSSLREKFKKFFDAVSDIIYEDCDDSFKYDSDFGDDYKTKKGDDYSNYSNNSDEFYKEYKTKKNEDPFNDDDFYKDYKPEKNEDPFSDDDFYKDYKTEKNEDSDDFFNYNNIVGDIHLNNDISNEKNISEFNKDEFNFDQYDNFENFNFENDINFSSNMTFHSNEDFIIQDNDATVFDNIIKDSSEYSSDFNQNIIDEYTFNPFTIETNINETNINETNINENNINENNNNFNMQQNINKNNKPDINIDFSYNGETDYTNSLTEEQRELFENELYNSFFTKKEIDILNELRGVDRWQFPDDTFNIDINGPVGKLLQYLRISKMKKHLPFSEFNHEELHNYKVGDNAWDAILEKVVKNYPKKRSYIKVKKVQENTVEMEETIVDLGESSESESFNKREDSISYAEESSLNAKPKKKIKLNNQESLTINNKSDSLKRETTSSNIAVNNLETELNCQPKKKGRPKKNDTPINNSTNTDTVVEELVNQPKKRGRPKKNDTPIINSTNTDTAVEELVNQPKKRGRPKKSETAINNSINADTVVEELVNQPKKRGRPKKNDTIKNNNSNITDKNDLFENPPYSYDFEHIPNTSYKVQMSKCEVDDLKNNPTYREFWTQEALKIERENTPNYMSQMNTLNSNTTLNSNFFSENPPTETFNQYDLARIKWKQERQQYIIDRDKREMEESLADEFKKNKINLLIKEKEEEDAVWDSYNLIDLENNAATNNQAKQIFESLKKSNPLRFSLKYKHDQDRPISDNTTENQNRIHTNNVDTNSSKKHLVQRYHFLLNEQELLRQKKPENDSETYWELKLETIREEINTISKKLYD